LLQSFQKAGDIRLLLLAHFGQLRPNFLHAHAVKLTIPICVVKSIASEFQEVS
jgi:hypothetical protein